MIRPKGISSIAVIPARGGSKRIPNKNIRPLAGIPILGRTISTLVASQCFERIVVSTDNPEVAEVAVSFGAEVPFMRPASISDDHTITNIVVKHAIQEMTTSGSQFDAVCCVYPCAAFMGQEDYRQAASLLPLAIDRDATVVVVSRFGHPLQRALGPTEDELLSPLTPQFMSSRTQDLEPAWHDCGQFYWASAKRWMSTDPVLYRVVPYEVPSWRVVDIDTEDDWIRAEQVFLNFSPGSNGQ